MKTEEGILEYSMADHDHLAFKSRLRKRMMRSGCQDVRSMLEWEERNLPENEKRAAR